MNGFIKFVDVPVSENRNIILEPNQKIVGIAITNEGTNDLLFAMGSQNAFRTLESGADVAYGNINGGANIMYLTGNLVIRAAGFADGQAWSSSFKCTYTTAIDVTGTEEDC